VIEEMGMLAQGIYDKIRASLCVMADLERRRKSAERQAIMESEKQKIRSLEQFVRLPCDEYLKTYQHARAIRPSAL
jgi:hypothetical protein